MIDVTCRLEAVRHHAPSGIAWIKLIGDDGFDWVLINHPKTPAGFVSIGGAANGSYRWIDKSDFEKLLITGGFEMTTTRTQTTAAISSRILAGLHPRPR